MNGFRLQVTFFGVRGSIPSPTAENLGFGGNTTCLELRSAENDWLVIDGGSGARKLGHLVRERGELDVHFWMTHFHWDHIQGLPFFSPLYDNRESQFCFHGPTRMCSLKSALEDQMNAPYFPVGLAEMQAQQQFYDLDEGRMQLDGVTLKTLWLNHPQGCMGFRMETKEGVLVYATDNEPGHPVFDENVRTLAEGADVLIYDAQYLPGEYEARRRGWGHSHWREAVNIAMESGAKELILFHHDPAHDDECIDNIVKEARNYYPKVRAASEGMQVELPLRRAAAQ